MEHIVNQVGEPGGLSSKESRLDEIEFLVHRYLPVLMRRAVARLHADADQQGTIIDADVGAALSLSAVDEATLVEGTAATRHKQVPFGAFHDRLKIDFSAGDYILEIVDRTEGEVDRMEAMQHPPA